MPAHLSGSFLPAMSERGVVVWLPKNPKVDLLSESSLANILPYILKPQHLFILDGIRALQLVTGYSLQGIHFDANIL